MTGRGNEACSAASASGLTDVNATSSTISSMMRTKAVEWPPVNRFDRSAIASNTGRTSDGEPAMTFKISAVAVCRSTLARSAFSASICSVTSVLVPNQRMTSPASLRIGRARDRNHR